MNRTTTAALRGLLTTALTLVPVAALAVPATAAAPGTTVTYQCRGSAAGQTADFELNQPLETSAPATVAPGGALTVVLDPAPIRIPGVVGGHKVKEVRNVKLQVAVPANASYASASLSGGSGLNSTPSVDHEDGDVVVTIPGPIKGGADIELPTLSLDLTAGDRGVIETRLTGSDHDNPGLTFTATIQVGVFPVNAPTTCYPNPSPTLTSTTIG
ncbi:hypothetical protein [Streptoalloteichus hindustanus]|uniref:Dehydratase n=1 Tax=Streptoalloteichus hindustanus TaxID=2017 RepID=A0A1M5BKA0_STRHI|nr:hypothetical protein [Streptoalloteichus hindustanus]SHF42888.1 dehydratase [Streptoalloteichus hindustanus]